MKIVNCVLLVLFMSVLSCNKDASDQKNYDYKKYIGKKYSRLSDLDTSLTAGGFMTIGDGTEYSIAIFGEKNWNPDKGSPKNALVFFEKLVGYSGDQSILQVIDVLSVDLTKYKPNSEVRINECTYAGDQEYSSVAVYQLEAASKTENGLKPERAWHPDIKKGKFIEVSPDSLLCQTEEGESE